MKKMITVTFAVLTLCLVCIFIAPTTAEAIEVASGTCGDNLTWVLDDEGTLTISGIGDMDNWEQVSVYAPWYDYSTRKSIKKVIIGEGITSVGDWAFYYCQNIESIELASSVQRVGAGAFCMCTKLKDISLFNGLNYIGGFAFSDCVNLKHIDLPTSVRSIEAYAFVRCSRLKTLSIPDSVSVIEQGLFKDCTALEWVDFPTFMKKIGCYVFDGCSSLKGIIIPNGVPEIDIGTFEDCVALEWVQIPTSVTKIALLAFPNCSSLTDIYYLGTERQYRQIKMGRENDSLDVAAIHYSSKAPCISHIYGSYTDNGDGTHCRTCSICAYVEKTTHTWDRGEITTKPTCATVGVKSYTCTDCKAIKTEEVAKTNEHTYGDWIRDGGQHKHTCSACGKEETAAHNWSSGKVTQKPTCKDEGEMTYTCITCGGTKTEPIDKTTDHVYGDWASDGEQHKHACSVCSKEETAAHNWNSGKVTKEPTCKDEGEKTYNCTDCGEVKTEVVEKSESHGEADIRNAVEATETSDGYTGDTYCTVCGEKIADGKVIPATGTAPDTNPQPEPTESTPSATAPTASGGATDKPENSGTVVAIVAVAAIAAVGGIAVVLILKKKR